MKLFFRFMLIAIFGIVLLTACGSDSQDMDDTVWSLISINGATPIEGTDITLRFEDGRVKGSSGCNTYEGDYTFGDEGEFQAGPIAVTEMACLDPAGVMDQEVEYLRILQGAETLARDDTELTIEGGGNTLVFWAIF
jgi:heat shock protein HslJ